MEQYAGTSSDVRGIPCRKGIAFVLACVMLLLADSVAFSFTQPAPKRLVLFAPEPVVTQGEVLVNLDITVDNEEGLANMLRDGAVLALGITLSIERVRSWWANAEAAQKEYLSVIRHDPLTRDFSLELPTPSGNKELRDKSLTRLLSASWRQLSLPLVSLAVLQAEEPAESYEILVTATLHHTEVPPWLEKSMLFWSSEVVPPQTRTATLVPPASSSTTRSDTGLQRQPRGVNALWACFASDFYGTLCTPVKAAISSFFRFAGFAPTP
ncbi:DUF4390 domain-containing protein [Desulfovibrio sp. OttesenSCG-928-G15]|nr:DUF4390 domain-containing protein [Desulfovibrio sp. OttesenSCG-928-G15]